MVQKFLPVVFFVTGEEIQGSESPKLRPYRVSR
jgi:hypothetical protein